MGTLLNTLQRMLRHRWLDGHDSRRAIPPEMVERLTQRVQASERRHSGEIRICVEAALPTSYLWRGLSARQRAVMMFAKLRAWDTAHNNGVLIYLLLAERAIEIVADRGLNSKVTPQEWQAMVQRMSAAFRDARYEDGLTQALGEVSALLVTHFPLTTGQPDRDELPNEPVLQ